jgi:AraC-like DNA-binding protein
MGICESSTTEKNPLEEREHIKFATSDLSTFDKYIKLNKKNNCPALNKYQRSFANKSSQMNKTKSESSTKNNEGEIIIRGEINKKCQNKEKDFNNRSFMKLVENNGGIIIKEKEKEEEKLNNNNPFIYFNKEKLSEIKTEESQDIDSYVTENEIFNELRTKKLSQLSNYSRNTLKRYMKNDIKSNYTSKTSKHSMNSSYIFTSKFNKSNLTYSNNTYQKRKYNCINLNRANFFNDAYVKKSLISYNNMSNPSNVSTSEDLMGSDISVPKNDEIIPESDLGIINNFEDNISKFSSEN